jgi:hypothetical protein
LLFKAPGPVFVKLVFVFGWYCVEVYDFPATAVIADLTRNVALVFNVELHVFSGVNDRVHGDMQKTASIDFIT